MARNHKHKTMPGPLFSYPKPYVPSRMLCKPEEVYEWSHDNAKSIEVTAVVCPALLCAFSSCSLVFFPLIFLSFLLPLGWYHCFSKCHTKLSFSSTKKKMATAIVLVWWLRPSLFSDDFILLATFLTPGHLGIAHWTTDGPRA